MKTIFDLNGACFYEKDFISNSEEAFGILERQINWRQDQISLYGKSFAVPRLHAWYGDPECHYQYSKIPLPINDWHPLLLEIKEKIEVKTGLRFNGVLLNYYRDGSDSNGWHADDESELVLPINVASVSLGQGRDFSFRKKGETKTHSKIFLEDGSLLVMKSPLQKHWQHSVPKRKNIEKGRINLTFRLVKKSARP